MQQRKKIALIIFLALAGAFLLGDTAWAYNDYFWESNSSGSWLEPSNWTNQHVPSGPTDHAIISRYDYGQTVYVNTDSGSIGKLTLGAHRTLSIGNHRDLTVYGPTTVVNDGLIEVNSSLYASKIIASGGAVTFAGSGTLKLGYYTDNQLDYSSTGSFINQSGHTIRQGGTIAAPLINNGTLWADNGHEMKITHNVTNYGVMKATGTNSNLHLTATVTGGTLEVGSGAYIYLDTAHLNSNPTLSGAGLVSVLNTSYVESNLTNNTTIVVTDSERLDLQNTPTITNYGLIKTVAAGHITDLQAHNCTVTLTGNGALELGGTSYDRLTDYSGGKFVNAAGHTIRGGGLISADLDNYGILHANLAGATLQITGAFYNNANAWIKTSNNGIFDNASSSNISSKIQLFSGTLKSSTGKSYTSTDFSGYGTVLSPVINNGTLTVTFGTLVFGPGSSLDNNGTLAVYSTLDNKTGNNMTISDGASHPAYLNGGTLQSTGSAEKTFYSHTLSGYGYITAPLHNSGLLTASGGTLTLSDSVANSGATLCTAGSGNTLKLSGNTVTGGTLNPNGGVVELHGATLAGVTVQSGTVNITDHSTVAGGQITMSNSPAGVLTVGSSTSLTFTGSPTLINTGTINIYGTLDNNSANNLTLSTGAGSVHLFGGTLQSTAGRSYTSQALDGYGLISAPLANTGSIVAQGGVAGHPRTLTITGSVTNYASATLATSGPYNTLELNSLIFQGNINPNGGTVALHGAYLDHTSLAAGTYTVIGGANTLNYAPLNNNAEFSLTAGTLSLIGYTGITNPFTILSGATLNNAYSSDFTLSPLIALAGGTLSSSSGQRYLNPSGNTFAGYGTIAADVTNDGTLRAQGGVLQLTGNVTNSGLTLDTAGFGNTLALSGVVTGGGINPNGGLIVLNNGTLSGATLGSGNFHVSGYAALTGTTTLAQDTMVFLQGLSSTLNLCGNVSGGQFYPGSGQINLMGANLSDATLGSGAVTVLSPSTLSGSNTSGATLSVPTGQTLNMAGGAVLINNANLQVGSALAIPKTTCLDNIGTTAVTLDGSGTVTLGGDKNFMLTSTGGGSFVNNATIQGGGTIAANLINNGIIMANRNTMTVAGQISGSGSVAVADLATLEVRNTLGAGPFTMAEKAKLIVADNQLIDLTGDFRFFQRDPATWSWGDNSALQMSGNQPQLVEVGSRDLGPVPNGFNDNFHLESFKLVGPHTFVSLVDNINNGQRQLAECLYAVSLYVGAGSTLDLNHLHLYTYLDGQLVDLPNFDVFPYGGGRVIGSPVPLPPSILLLATGLLGLAFHRRLNRSS